MSSSDSSSPLDLAAGHPVTPEDVAAQRVLAPKAIPTLEEYFEWLAQFPSPTYEELKARRGPCGEPFTLPF
jgi:hypothetical protein